MNTSASTQKEVKYIILEDDICYDWDDYGVWGIVYYDIEKKSIFTDKYGHGTDSSYRSESVELDKAIESGLATAEDIITAMLNSLPIDPMEYYLIRNFAANHSEENPTAIPVKVTRGRKFKGEGYIIYAEWEYERYGLGAYRNEKNYYPMIFDPATCEVRKINSFGYVELDEQFKDDFRKRVFAAVPKTTVQVRRIAHAWAYNMSYSACDRDNYTALVNSIARLGYDGIEVPEVITNTMKAIIAEREAKKQAKMKEELPAIIEWVKTHTDKEGDQIIQLAEHIWRKHHG